MNDISTQLEEVINYCKVNDRVCPMPQLWNKLYQQWKNTKQKSGGGWEPGLPLILQVWYDASAMAKQIRLIEHLKWAEKENQLDEIFSFLKNLKEEEWFHLND